MLYDELLQEYDEELKPPFEEQKDRDRTIGVPVHVASEKNSYAR